MGRRFCIRFGRRGDLVCEIDNSRRSRTARGRIRGLVFVWSGHRVCVSKAVCR